MYFFCAKLKCTENITNYLTINPFTVLGKYPGQLNKLMFPNNNHFFFYETKSTTF